MKKKPAKRKCPYCKKVHRCHNKCASKRVSRRITREGRPRAAKRVGYAIARGCSTRRGRKSKRKGRATKRGSRSRTRPASFWKKRQMRLRQSDVAEMERLEKAGKGMLIPGLGWMPSA